MLKKNAQFFKSLFMMSDMAVIALTWILSYLIRFDLLVIPPALGIPSFSIHILFLMPLWVIWGFVSSKMRLYQPRRMGQFRREIVDIAESVTLTFIILVTVIYLLGNFEFSRMVFFDFWVLAAFGLLGSRYVTRRMLRHIRKRGYNLRFALIVGAGELGQSLLEKIDLFPELGIQVVGFLTSPGDHFGEKVKGIPILGTYGDFDKIIDEETIDIFFIALPIGENNYLENMVRKLRNHLSDVKVIPGAYQFISMIGGMDELDGLPILSLQNSPLFGWNKVFKRFFDVAMAGIMLVAASPLLLAISVLVKMTSKGPILYRQERISLGGDLFQMLKFRTMRVDAEEESGPVWAQENDPRRTKIGSLIRRTSLDELPQLFNVLKGEMSLVGPRPERPTFVEEFQKRIPSYVLRHKIRSGMTGWAQINGWRGNTSLEKRIEHDLYYMRHWSIGFDLRILVMTLWKGIFCKSAY